MNSPENLGLLEKETPQILETSWRNVTVRLLEAADLPEFKELLEKNADYFMRGHIGSGLYDIVDREVENGNSNNQRFGIWHRDTLIGYVGLTASDDPEKTNEFDIAYAIDQENAGLGIGTAAVDAVVKYESELENTVTAEVESDNRGSIRVLKKLGFTATEQNNDRHRPVFIKK